MTKGLEFNPAAGTLKFLDGTRTVIANDRKLVNFLPTQYIATINVVFPDFAKDYLYNWNWVNDYTSLGGLVAEDNGCSTQVTVIPQEWSDTTNLASAPTDADITISMIRINRTAAPSHSWGGSPIDVLPPQGVWIPFNGSVLVEAELGMARAFSLYQSGGNLVLHRQQSVSTAPGGWGAYGNPGFSWVAPADGNGGENVYGSNPGIPVVQIDLQNSPATIEDVNISTPPYKQNHRRGGGNACSTSLSTNFSSTYQVEIVGTFGRRS